MKKLILYLLFIVVIIGCMDKIDVRNITINNNSESEIVYSLSITDSVFDLEKLKIQQQLLNGEQFYSIDITGLFIDSVMQKEINIINK